VLLGSRLDQRAPVQFLRFAQASRAALDALRQRPPVAPFFGAPPERRPRQSGLPIPINPVPHGDTEAGMDAPCVFMVGPTGKIASWNSDCEQLLG
jgi:hypothetical protein